MSETHTEEVGAAASETTEETQETTDAPKSYTQRQLDDMVRYRVKKKDEEVSQLRAQLQEFEDAKKTDLEKAQERAAQLEKQAADATARAQESILRATVVAEAARKNVVDPDAAFTLLDRTSLQFGEDGEPLNIAEAMDSLLTAKPYLVGGNGRSADLGARDRGAVGEQLGREDAKSMTAEEIVAARRAGKFDDVLTGKT